MMRLIRKTIQARPGVQQMLGVRYYSEVPEMTETEKKLTTVLNQSFPSAEFIQVEDISGGCGAMFDIQIISSEFENKRKVDQHRLVNVALKKEIPDIHGLRIRTAPPSKT